MTNATEQSGGAQTRVDPRATIARLNATVSFLANSLDVQVTAQFQMQEELTQKHQEIERLTAEAARLSGEVDKLREERTDLQNRLNAYAAADEDIDEANHAA